MSKKQLKKIITIVVSAVLGIALLIGGYFFIMSGDDGSGGDIDAIKESGGYERLKSDIISVMRMRDTQALEVGDVFFEKVGIKQYDSLNKNGVKGNFIINADGYEFDTYIAQNKVGAVYIGNAVVYRDAGVLSTLPATVVEYNYKNFDSIVKSFAKATGIEFGQ